MDAINETEVIDLALHDEELKSIIVAIRMVYKIKLPDAIIAASAISRNAILISNDRDFTRIPFLQLINY